MTNVNNLAMSSVSFEEKPSPGGRGGVYRLPSPGQAYPGIWGKSFSWKQGVIGWEGTDALKWLARPNLNG